MSSGVNTLAHLELGRRARIKQVSGDDEIAVRLLEMGLTPGSETSVVGIAPLGDPIEIEIRHYRLSLRKSEAERVQIEESPSP